MTRVARAGAGDQASVTVEFSPPPVALAPYVSAFYVTRIDSGDIVEDYLHPEWANIRITLYGEWEAKNPGEPLRPAAKAVVHGPTSQMTFFRGRGAGSFGIGLLPAGWARLVRGQACKYADRTVPIQSIFGDEGAALSREISAANNIADMAAHATLFLCDLLDRYPPSITDTQVARAHALLLDPDTQSVDEMAEQLGLSGSALVRFSKKHFGFTPKLLLSRQRFLRMLGEMHMRPHTEWRDFLDPHYVDQSHMIRDFQKFLGMSPGRYFALDRPILRAAAAGRAAALGAPLQGLHQPSA